MTRLILYFLIVLTITSCAGKKTINDIKSYSGIYPHLAYYNNEASECGTGAVVPWQDRLWVISYGAANPYGSSDKLYEITPELKQIVRSESIGGTHANRMIHKESNQLIIGPYAINKDREVRAIHSSIMPGRMTGNARHLFDPENKIYFAGMEEGLYEVDVNTLVPNVLYKDSCIIFQKKQDHWPHVGYAGLLGSHGKGLYSGQGVLVYSNNGEVGEEALTNLNLATGALYEWDGNTWKLIRRQQFTEVTGPGGITGNENPATDPIWTVGWDVKSLILGVREVTKGWRFYRLPKASHSYDGAHGWNTEWPRIRDIGTKQNPDFLMTMHGMFWKFPKEFNSSNSKGIRPRSSYLKVIGDFTRWNGRLVFGCDDSAQNEFLNKRKVKGSIGGAGQSNSNLWFTSLDKIDNLGPTTAEGAVWISEDINAHEKSDPFLFTGWDTRGVWINNEGSVSCTFMFEIDEKGNDTWVDYHKIKVPAGKSIFLDFSKNKQAEWIRVSADNSTTATVHFYFGQSEKRNNKTNSIFRGIAEVNQEYAKGGFLWGLDRNRRKLGILAGITTNKSFEEIGYYELDSAMNLIKTEDKNTSDRIRNRLAIPTEVLTIDNASVLIIDDSGRRWRLPKGNTKFEDLTTNGLLRICREVATERDLFNCAGTFYELPAENADGFAKIRPVSSHNYRIHDYASYRGLLVMTDVEPNTNIKNKHIITSTDGKASVWVGTIDDLWNLGKPRGEGGPWKDSSIKKHQPSDPYLIGFYDKRTLNLSHKSKETVAFTIEVEPIGHGPWMEYKTINVKPNQVISFTFPRSFQSRWIRFKSDKDCVATAWLKYE